MKKRVIAIAVMLVVGTLTIATVSVPAARAQENRDPAVLAYDDFAGGLGLDWEIRHPDFSHWSLSRRPGTLTITTQDGHFTHSQTNYKNLFLIGCPAAPQEDFESTTSVSFQPVDEFNKAGLVLYHDDDNFLAFVYEWGSGPVVGLGNGLRQFTINVATNGRNSIAYFHADQALERVWLRITKQGDRYTFSTSLDGKMFVVSDTPYFNPYRIFDGGVRWGDGTVRQVGLFANNSSFGNDPPEVEASFDFFEVKGLTESRNAERPLGPGEKKRTEPPQLLESLHHAIVAGDLARVKAVIAEGANINAKDAQGATALHWAAKEGNKDIVGLLLGMGASPTTPTEACNWTPLHLAAMAGKNDVVQLLMDKGVPLDRQGFKGRLPFHLAVLGGHAETVSLLLQHDAQINDKDSEGRTALHYAVIQRREDLARRLLAKGADVNVVDDKGRTPLSIAKEKHRGEMADLLLEHGAKK